MFLKNIKGIRAYEQLFFVNNNGRYTSTGIISLNKYIKDDEFTLTPIHELLHSITKNGLENNQSTGLCLNEMTVENLAITIGKEYFNINIPFKYWTFFFYNMTIYQIFFLHSNINIITKKITIS